MQLTYTQHALRQMERREIPWSWVERVVASPSHRTRDPEDSTVERDSLGQLKSMMAECCVRR